MARPPAYVLPSLTIAHPAAGVNQPEACGELVYLKPSVLKVCYIGSNMIIRKTDGVTFGNDVPTGTVKNSLFSIPPLLGISSTPPNDLPNLNSPCTFHGFMIKLDDNSIRARAYCEINDKSREINDKSIEFHEDHGTIRAVISKAFEERLSRMAKDVGRRLFRGQ